MKKKIIVSALAVLTLTSCGNPKIENPSDALKQNQVSIIEDINSLMETYPEMWESKWTINFDIKAKEWDLDWKIDYTSKFIEKGLKGSTDLDIKLNAKVSDKMPSPVKDLSWNINLNLITLKNKVIFKLNSLNIDNIEENPQLAMITWMVAPFQKKWYFIDMPESPYSDIQTNLLKNSKKILEIAKNNIVLKFVKENENKDFYDYNVIVSEESAINFSKEMKKIYITDKEESKLTEKEITEIKESVKDFNENIKLNIKIEKSNLKFFTLTAKNKEWELKIINTKTNLDFTFNSDETKTNVQFIWKKSKNKIDWNIIVKIENKEITNGNISSSYNNWKTEFSADISTKFNWEEMTFKINLSDNTTKKSVKIEEPSDAKDFKEVMSSVMWWMMWTPTQINTTIPEEVKTEEVKKVEETKTDK